ncbi:lactate permease [Alteromonadaceae bacterium Bs31]|nr:lactate permease [Alteromonadaceae bacterium Bs31]
MSQLFFAYFPIIFLIFLMTKKKSMPSYRALPLAALVLYFIMLIVFNQNPNALHAAVLDGLLVAWTPALIIAGAIFLFRAMEASGAQDVIRVWLNRLSDNPIAQLMIVGWAFQFLIEGASGFGTPAALAAPVLVGLGFPALRVAILCLILNSVPVSFGAVGTPTWFGLSEISMTSSELLEVGFKSAWLNSIAAFFIVPIALLMVVDKKTIIKNSVFIVLSILSCTVPYIVITYFSYEFPALLGGGVGLLLTVVLAYLGVGLQGPGGEKNRPSTEQAISGLQLLKAGFPLWGTVLVLIITRIPALGIKPLLQLSEPNLAVSLGSLGELNVSAALVISLQGIFGTAQSWSHSLLYVPSLLPFGLVALITLQIHRQGQVRDVFAGTVEQMKKPMLALLGALVFVKLMMMGGGESAVTLIGRNLAGLSGEYWQYFAAFLGALGSFFSGSATISNLTFAGIQDSIALELALNRTSILALQSVGGAMGNMVCINNIVAVASVLALADKEGYILKRTVVAMLVYGIVVGISSLVIFS